MEVYRFQLAVNCFLPHNDLNSDFQQDAEELYEDLRAIAEKFKISKTRNENIVIWSSSGDEMSALSFHSVMAGFFQKIQRLCGIEPDVYSEIYSASFAKRCKR